MDFFSGGIKRMSGGRKVYVQQDPLPKNDVVVQKMLAHSTKQKKPAIIIA